MSDLREKLANYWQLSIAEQNKIKQAVLLPEEKEDSLQMKMKEFVEDEVVSTTWWKEDPDTTISLYRDGRVSIRNEEGIPKELVESLINKLGGRSGQ
jgi:hypothetical protein